ncbi:MAG: NCS2 family permease [Anaerorhabdus sp.]
MKKIESFFKFHEMGTSFKIELIAGITTFMTMAYVLAVQPSAIVGFGAEPGLVDINGVFISKEAILIVTALISALITLFMALYTNLPFALSTGMGSNFMFGAMLQGGEISFSAVMTMTLVSGIVFLILSIFGIRDLIVRMIPKNIKLAISTAIGFFIAYLGFKNTGIGNFSSGIGMGNFTDPAVFLAIAGLVIIAILTAYKIKGAILIGIVAITLLGIPFGVTTVPGALFKIPASESVSNVVFQFDFSTLFSFEAIVLMFIAFFGDFFSTLGTVLGVGAKAGMLDRDGNFPDIQKPFLVDAVGTVAGATLGCTTVTTYVESSAGVEAGGRTGFTALVVAVLFAITIFCAPLFLMIPDAATGPALIFVGFLMIKGFKEIDFDDFTESFGPFVMIMFTIFTGSIASGISAGIIAYILIKVATGKAKEVHPGMYVLAVPLLLYFITQSTM